MIVTGVPSMPYFRIESNDPKIHTNWVDACLSKGIYLTSYHNHFLSTVHGEEEINVFINKAKEALKYLLRKYLRLLFNFLIIMNQ